MRNIALRVRTKNYSTKSCENAFNEIENGEIDERKHTDGTKLDLSRTNNEIIKSWTLGALKMRKRIKKTLTSDIRRFLGGECVKHGYNCSL